MRDQKLNPKDYKYKIIKLFNTREEAVNYEILLHIKFNVAAHSKFYNKANQKISGFDSHNCVVVAEIATGKLIRIHKSLIDSSIHKPFPRATFTATISATGERIKVTSAEFASRDDLEFHSKDTVACYDSTLKKNRRIPKAEYDDNRDRYSSCTQDSIVATDKTTGVKTKMHKSEYDKSLHKTHLSSRVFIFDNISKTSYYISSEEYLADEKLDIRRYTFRTKGMVVCKLVNTGESMMVSKSEFDSRADLVGIAAGTVNVRDLKNNKNSRITRDVLEANPDRYMMHATWYILEKQKSS